MGSFSKTFGVSAGLVAVAMAAFFAAPANVRGISIFLSGGAQPAVALSMNPSSGFPAGGTSVATVSVTNTSASAQICRLKGYAVDGNGNTTGTVIDATDPAFTVPPQTATSSQASTTRAYITTVGNTVWRVPAGWNNASNTIEVIGGGGGGDNGGGGGGGGYSRMSNITLTPGSDITIVVGSGGAAKTAGGDSYVCSDTACSSITSGSVIVGAKGGLGANGLSGASGGQGIIGAITYSGGGGASRPGANDKGGGGGGGGAAGPLGNGGHGGGEDGGINEGGGGGGNGGGSDGLKPAGGCGFFGGGNCGGKGGNNAQKTGGAGAANGASNSNQYGRNGGGGGGGDDYPNGWGGPGGNGIEWTSTGNNGSAAGSGGGGGGGGGSGNANSGGAGGLYGGGGGGHSYLGGSGGSGAQGIAVLSYTVSAPDNGATHTSSHTVNVTTDFSVTCLPSNAKSNVVRVTPLNSCQLGGVSVPNGTSHVFYSTSLVPYGQSCNGTDPSGVPYSQLRTCKDGVLSGSASYGFGTCSSASAPVQTDVTLSASSELVRNGNSVTFTWDGGNSSACTLSGTNGFSSNLIQATNFPSGPITQKSVFTLSCSLGNSVKQASVTVNLLPTVVEVYPGLW